jgi:CheY-like chemotaxis protein
MTELLETEGYTVESAANGDEGIRALLRSAFLPSLILLDIMMPVKDGFQFREEQQLVPMLAAIPVVVMTADGSIEAKRVRIGATEAIKKPFNINDIIEVVRRNCA